MRTKSTIRWIHLASVVCLLVATLATRGVGVAVATACTQDGGMYGPMMPAGAGCQVHHILSAWALEQTKDVRTLAHPNGHGITRYSGPGVRMPIADHQNTDSWGTAGAAERRLEVKEILQYGILEAFERAAARFLLEFPGYGPAVDQARQALLQRLGLGGGDPPDGPQVGLAVAANNNDSNPPPPPPGAGGAVAATANDTIKASASGLGPTRAGQEFDLLLADAAQLGRDPNCLHSPTVISSGSTVVDSSGNIPLLTASLSTTHWEIGGELDDFVPTPGTGAICFALGSNHRSVGTASAPLMIYPPAVAAPMIYPPAQTASATRSGYWTVAVPLSATVMTLSFCFGDGICAPNKTVSAGAGSTTFSFSHIFGTTGTYAQTATVGGAMAKSVTVAETQTC